MDFFKNTKSFEMVTILEKMKVTYGIFNIIKYIIKYEIKLLETIAFYLKSAIILKEYLFLR